MKFRRLHSIVLAVFIFLFVFNGCTSNPFGGNEISSSRQSIAGIVQLENISDAGDVFVWLEGFEIGTRTNSKGEFKLTLPPPSAQGVEGGTDGAFTLYFYTANYQLVKKNVAIRSGSFIYEDGINSRGEFSLPVFLKQALNIKVRIQPESVPNNVENLVSARTEFTTTSGPVTVFFPLTFENYKAPLIFRNITTREISIHNSDLVGADFSENLVVDKEEPYVRTLLTGFDAEEIPVGEYEIIPYFFVINDEVPEALFSSIDEEIERVGQNYLQLPIKRIEGKLVVVDVPDDEIDN